MNDLKVPGIPLKRTLGLFSLIAIGVGQVIGQGAFVSILQGVGIGGSGFFVAMLIAFVLTLGHIFTFIELSLMMPKAGGISTYTEVAAGHLPAIVVTIGGYLGIAIFAGAADLFLLDYVFGVLYPNSIGHIGLWVYIIMMILNILGVDVFASVQNFIVYTMTVALLILGVAGVSSSDVRDIPFSNLITNSGSLGWDILPLTMLALFAFLGLEFVCPLIEETIQPERNVPRAMFISSFVFLLVYGLIALAGFHKMPGSELVKSSIPHVALVESIFGEGGRILTAFLVITASTSSFSSGVAAISRMLFGMAKNNQLPAVFGLVHPKFKTPWFGIIFQCGLAILVYVVLQNSQNVVMLLVTSCVTVWLMVYIMAHIDLIILRKKYPQFQRPYRSPLFPVFQILGIISMIYLIINNSPSPEMTRDVYVNAGLFVGVTALYAVFWIKFKMKKKFFKGEPIESVL
jgi:amino acid transporter